jgi:TatD DNase family protein
MKGWIDTHAHLDFPDFSEDLDILLVRSGEAGVKKIITIGTDLQSSRTAIQLAEKYHQIYAVIGIHPGNVQEESDQALGELEPLLHHPKVVAIGECGTDYHYPPKRLDHEPEEKYEERWNKMKERQFLFFRNQLELAARHHLNVVIHQRDSWEDTVRILQEFSGRLKAVFHCFGGTKEQASEILSLGHLVSFTGIISFKNASQVRATAASLPVGSFMIETDCPYLAPVPHRGQRCEPSHVREIAAILCQERQISPEALSEELWKTTHSFFKIIR